MYECACVLFIELLCPIRLVTQGSRTALHYAAWRGHETVVEYLVDNGAHTEAKSWVSGVDLRVSLKYGCISSPESLHVWLTQLMCETM